MANENTMNGDNLAAIQANCPLPAKGLGVIFLVAIALLVHVLMRALTPLLGISASVIPFIVAYWCTRNFFFAKSEKHSQDYEKVTIAKEDLEKPYPREYKLPLAIAFDRVLDVIDETVHGVGKTWQRKNQSPENRKIVANLPLRGKRNEADRHLQVKITFQETDKETTILTFEFKPTVDTEEVISKVDIVAWLFGCSAEIKQFIRAIDVHLEQGTPVFGPGAVRKEQLKRHYYTIEFQAMPTPSWKLLAVSCFGLLVFICNLIVWLLP